LTPIQIDQVRVIDHHVLPHLDVGSDHETSASVHRSIRIARSASKGGKLTKRGRIMEKGEPPSASAILPITTYSDLGNSASRKGMVWNSRLPSMVQGRLPPSQTMSKKARRPA